MRAPLRRAAADDSGTTLIELLAVAAIVGIVFGAALIFFQGANNRRADTEARKDVLEVERVAIERMARDIREGETSVVRETGSGPATPSGNIVDITGPAAAVLYDCTGGTCLRSEFDPGTGALTDGPDQLISGLEVAEPVFRSGSEADGADTNYVNVRLSLLPRDRDREIVLVRGVTVRNDCDLPASILLPPCD